MIIQLLSLALILAFIAGGTMWFLMNQDIHTNIKIGVRVVIFTGVAAFGIGIATLFIVGLSLLNS
jgi:hypothetical protein